MEELNVGQLGLMVSCNEFSYFNIQNFVYNTLLTFIFTHIYVIENRVRIN